MALLWQAAAVSAWQAAVRPCARPRTVRAGPRASASSEAASFGAALAQAWQQDPTALRELLGRDVVVDTPIWSCTDAADYLEKLGEAAVFFGGSDDEFGRAGETAPAQLNVLSEQQLPSGETRVEWVLGVEWPSLWRARVNLLGESLVRFDSAGERVREVTETWHQSPQQAFVQQVLPRRRDLMSLYNSPTAEHVPQKVERVGRGYEVRRLPPMLTVQAETVEAGETMYEEQAPLAPSFAFTGEVKRTEWYSTVSPALLERAFTTISMPGGMEQPAQRRRFILPLPTRFGLDPAALAPADSGLEQDPGTGAAGVQQASVQLVRRPSQRLAVGTVKGYPSNAAVLETVSRLSEAVRRDGLRFVTQGGRPVFVHLCYDVKNGFNRKGQLAMAVWLAQPGWLQENEVALVLEDDTDSDT